MTIKELMEHLLLFPEDTKIILDTEHGLKDLIRLPIPTRVFKIDDKYFDREPFDNYVEIKDWEDVILVKG